MLRLIEERVPTLVELLCVLVLGRWCFFPGRIIVKNLLRLLLGCNHAFDLVQELCVDI